MALNLNITYDDIEKRLRSFQLADESDWIDGLIEENTILLEPKVRRLGICDTSDVTSTSHNAIYVSLRIVVILRVTAEVMISFSHEWGDAAKRREAKAEEILIEMERHPENFIDNFDPHKHLGTVDWASEDEGINMHPANGSWIGGSWKDMEGA